MHQQNKKSMNLKPGLMQLRDHKAMHKKISVNTKTNKPKKKPMIQLKMINGEIDSNHKLLP
jgi:hypothetical protein